MKLIWTSSLILFWLPLVASKLIPFFDPNLSASNPDSDRDHLTRKLKELKRLSASRKLQVTPSSDSIQKGYQLPEEPTGDSVRKGQVAPANGSVRKDRRTSATPENDSVLKGRQRGEFLPHSTHGRSLGVGGMGGKLPFRKGEKATDTKEAESTKNSSVKGSTAKATSPTGKQKDAASKFVDRIGDQSACLCESPPCDCEGYRSGFETTKFEFVLVRDDVGSPSQRDDFGIASSIGLNGRVFNMVQNANGDIQSGEAAMGLFKGICTVVSVEPSSLLCTYEIEFTGSTGGNLGVASVIVNGPVGSQPSSAVVTGTGYDFAPYTSGELVTVQEPNGEPMLYGYLTLNK